MGLYINMKGEHGIETVCEYKTGERKLAKADVREYRKSGDGLHYYLSNRATKDWRASRCQ